VNARATSPGTGDRCRHVAVSRRPTLVTVADERTGNDHTVAVEAVLNGAVRHRLTHARAGVDLVCPVVASDKATTHGTKMQNRICTKIYVQVQMVQVTDKHAYILI